MIDKLKLKIKKWLKGRDYHLYLSGHLTNVFFELLLYELLKRNNRLFYIQIGANDGVNFDPLYDFIRANQRRVSGIAVEPLTDYYEEFLFNYRQYPNITAINAAIHNTEKQMTIYRVSPEQLADFPGWAKGASSFKKGKLVLSDKIDPQAIISETVPCISFDELLRKYQIKTVDLLQIDTEGYDYEIISQINFDHIKPLIIHFEHGLPKGIMSRPELDKLRDLLHRNGYELWLTQWDCVAYQSEILVEL